MTSVALYTRNRRAHPPESSTAHESPVFPTVLVVM